MNPEWIGCAQHNFRQGRPGGFRPELIVIHVIVGSLLSADRWFGNPAASVSAHYGVGCDGRVHQYVNEKDTAFHAGILINPACKLVLAQPNVNPNYYSIGIEHEGQPEDAWTFEQAAASATLIAQIAQRWNIPIDDQHVIPHHDIRASKTCPGDLRKVDILIAGARAVASRGLLVTTAQPVPAPVPTVPVGRLQPTMVPEASVTPAPAPQVQSAAVNPPVPVSSPLACTPTPPSQPVAAYPREIRILTTVRVRKGAPNTAAAPVTLLQAHALFSATGAALGENIQGNPAWFQNADGNFIWAGATDAPHPEL